MQVTAFVDLKKMSREDLERLLREAKMEVHHLLQEVRVHQLKKVDAIKKAKRMVARILTALQQFQS